MNEIDNQQRLPVKASPQALSHGFIWINNRRSSIKTRRLSGISSLLMLPIFGLELLLLSLIMSLLLFSVSIYVIFRLLASLPKLRKGHFRWLA